MDFATAWRRIWPMTRFGLRIGSLGALPLAAIAMVGFVLAGEKARLDECYVFFAALLGVVIVSGLVTGGSALVEAIGPLVREQCFCIRVNGDAIEQVLFNRYVLRRASVSRFTRVEEHAGPPRLVFQGGQVIPLKGMRPTDQADLTTRLRTILTAKVAACRQPPRPVVIDPAWLLWEGGIVRHIAEAIADVEPFDRMPILADALEDAGCADEALLSHLRSGGCHADDCWALKLILGKS